MKRTRLWAARLRVLVALVAILCADLVFASPASAGTLTAPTWTVMDPRTNISGNRYDYGFTTATPGTVARVTATVPAGTSGSNRYLALSGDPNNFASTPSSPANTFTGDIDIRASFSTPVWPPGSGKYLILVNKQGNAASRDYEFYMDPAGALILLTSPDGSNWVSAGATVPPPVTVNTKTWVRVTRDMDNGAGGSTTVFSTSTDGTNWTQLGSPRVVAGTTSLRSSSSSVVEIGTINNGGGQASRENVYYADIRSGLGNATVSPSNCSTVVVANCFDANNAPVGSTTWTSASPTAETWTIGRSGTNLPADIASDLSVMNVSGVTAGGAAQLREIDGVASYTLPTPQALAASVPVKLGLGGIANTFTTGSYSTVLKTLDATGTAIDTSAASANVAITAPTVGTFAGALPTVYNSPTVATSISITPGAVTVSGNLIYVTDRYSASVMALDTTTGKVTNKIGTGATSGLSPNSPALTAPLWNPDGVTTTPSGDLIVANTAQCLVLKVVSGTSTYLAGTASGDCGYNGDGVATAKRLSSPSGMSTDAAGNIYFADRGNSLVRKIDTSGNLTTIAGTGVAGFNGDGITATTSQLNKPVDAFVSAAGDVYISDTGNSRVRMIDHTTGLIQTLAGTGIGGFDPDGAAATSTRISGPFGVALDLSGNLIFADSGNNRIRKISSGIVSTIAGTGVGGYSGDGALATSAQIAYPRYLRVDSAGNIVIADASNNRVRKIDTSGIITTIIGNGSAISNTGDGGQASTARFWGPQQIFSTSSGDTYIADSGNNSIRRINQFGIVSTVAGAGPNRGGDYGEGGSATSAGLNGPNAVAMTPDGTLYVGDNNSFKLKKVVNGIITTVASNISVDRLSVDTANNVYVSGDCKITRYNSAGVSTVFAGTGSCGAAGDNGPATSAPINNPRELVFDSNGNAFFGDNGNRKVRMITTDGIIRTVAGGGGLSGSNIPATSANLNGVRGLFVDSANNIYFDDWTAIKKFTVGGPLVHVLNPPANGGGLTANNGSLYVSEYNTHRIFKVNDAASFAPLVNNDALTVPMNTARSWPILSNDWSRSLQMDPSSVSIVTPPTNGIVTLNPSPTEASTLQAVYTPTTSYTGSDSYTYRACDTTRVACGTATVSLTVANYAVTTVAGGISEGYAQDIGFSGGTVTRFGRYLFIGDITFSGIRRYDTYSGQIVSVAGLGVPQGSTENVPGTSSGLNGGPGIGMFPDGTIIYSDFGNVRIRQIATSGIVTTIAGTGSSGYSPSGTLATSAMFNSLGISISMDGTIYASSLGVIQSFKPGGTLTNMVGTGVAGNNGDGPVTSSQVSSAGPVIVNANGDVYFSDSGNNAIRMISNGNVTTVAGTLGSTGSSNGTSALTATLNSPRALMFDGTGGIIFADYNNSFVRRFAPGGTMTTIAGGGASTTVSTANAFNMNGVFGLTPNGSGGYWATLRTGQRLVSADGANATSTVTSLSNSLSTANNSPSGKPGTQTQSGLAAYSNGVLADSSGNVYYNDTTNHRIRRVDAVTGISTSVVGDGTGAGIQNPSSQLAFDKTGRLTFIDQVCRVRSLNSDASLTTIAGTGTCGFSGDGSVATSARINATTGGIGFDAAGNLYIADKGNQRIRRVDAVSGVITTIAGDGSAAYTGDGQAASTAQFSSPQGIQVDSAGNIFIADTGNNAVRMIDASGIVTTMISGLSTPRAIALDPSGSLYVADTGSNRIYLVTTKGTIFQTAGGGGVAGDANTVAAAVVSVPGGVAFSGSTMYIQDVGTNRIRRFNGVGRSSASPIASVKWSVVPGGQGHANVRERFVLTPAADTVSSRLVASLPTGVTAGTLSVTDNYGLSGSVTASLTGTTLTVNYPSQTLTSGVPISFGIEGFTSVGAIGNWTATTNLRDSTGSSVTGVIQTNVVTQTSSSGPAKTDPGFGSIWKRSLITNSSVPPNVAVNPGTATDATSLLTLTNTGTINGNNVSAGTTAMSAGAYNLTTITADSTTSVASASFPLNRWGLQIVTATGTSSAATGAGLYGGLSIGLSNVVTNTAGNNVTSLTTRARINYLQPAGTYKSTLNWRIAGGV